MAACPILPPDYSEEATLVCRRAFAVAASINREGLPGLEVQDVAQDVRLAVISATARRYNRGLNDSLGGYLHKRLRGAAHDAVRFERRHAAHRTDYDGELPFPAKGLQPDQRAAASELHDVLAEAIQELPPRWRLVIVSVFFRQRTLRQTGAILGTSQARAAQIKQRAIKRLKVILERRGLTSIAGAIF